MMTTKSRAIRVTLVIICVVITGISYAQSPEILLREFASGQIKKGVRSIGMGGDGATWGNYALVWRDTSTALLDAGETIYSNDNAFSFTAVGFTTPSLWHHLAVYVIALSQNAGNIGTSLKTASSGSTAMHGDGTNQGIFLKTAMPLGKGFSAGILLSYERSQFTAVSDNAPTSYLKYHTDWVPSGGFGVTWQPNKRILAGIRGLFNQDDERKTDNGVTSAGLNFVQEYRAGVSVGLWKGALIDAGGNVRHKYNRITKVGQTDTEPNLGFEQNLWNRHFAIRGGIDETSGTGGFSVRYKMFALDVAYVNDLAKVRVGSLFGTSSNSVITTLTFDYGKYYKRG